MCAFGVKQNKARFASCAALAGTSAIVITVALSFLAGAQSLAQSPPAPPTAPSKQAVPDLPKVYMPGLGEFMQVIQTHHAKLWLAARANNWPLAEYQLSEMKEVFSEVQELVPNYKRVPVGQMIDAIVTGTIASLEQAVVKKNIKAFSAGYDKLTTACNDCHKAASRGFIQIRKPARSSFDNQEFRAPRQ